MIECLCFHPLAAYVAVLIFARYVCVATFLSAFTLIFYRETFKTIQMLTSLLVGSAASATLFPIPGASTQGLQKKRRDAMHRGC